MLILNLIAVLHTSEVSLPVIVLSNSSLFVLLENPDDCIPVLIHALLQNAQELWGAGKSLLTAPMAVTGQSLFSGLQSLPL